MLKFITRYPETTAAIILSIASVLGMGALTVDYLSRSTPQYKMQLSSDIQLDFKNRLQQYISAATGEPLNITKESSNFKDGRETSIVYTIHAKNLEQNKKITADVNRLTDEARESFRKKGIPTSLSVLYIVDKQENSADKL